MAKRHVEDTQDVPVLDAQDIRVGVVVSRFNSHITRALWETCHRELKALNLQDDRLRMITVPGALEIPLALKLLAQSGDFDVLIALGCVIRGETYHYELVCQQSARGIIDVQLALDIPIVNEVLTVENNEQALARIDEKGRDAAQVAVEMAWLRRELRAS